MAATSLRFVLAGQLKRDFALLTSGKSFVDVLGGNVVYAAAGFGVWEQPHLAGILTRVGEDYPREWLDEIHRRGFDIRGIRILPEAIDLRNFYAYSDGHKFVEDPAAHFTRFKLPFPKALLNYSHPGSTYDSRSQLTSTSLRQADFPEEFLDATAAHLCPIDYLTHTLLPAVLRQNGFSTVTLDPSPGSMSPSFWDDIPALVTGLTCFMPNEDEIRRLFHGRCSDIWEMMEAIADYGCDMVVVKRGERGQYLFERASRARWEIPAYPARVVDPTGAGDAYCGGFLSGYRQTYEPTQAALYGSISASMTVEGSGAFYAMDSLPGLAQARLESIKDALRRI